MRHGDPCVVNVTIRRTLCNVGFNRFAPSGSSHATPQAHTRSIQPFSTAGCAPHHVGWTNTNASHQRNSSKYSAR